MKAPDGHRLISPSEARFGDLVLIERARKWRVVREVDRWGGIVCSIDPKAHRVDIVLPGGIVAVARSTALRLVT